jgi:thiamine-phosphate pyrophosphorylase
VLRANCNRVEESLRTLEEYGKLIDPAAAADIEQLRYRFYTLEKSLLITDTSRSRLANCRLYLLVTESASRGGIERVVKSALEGGVDAVQLREKQGDDRRLLVLAEQVRRWTTDAGALFILNDRPDIAVLSEADGVHVGQEDLSVDQARRIIGPEQLVGVSTHTIDQARQAVLDGADYLGVGPTFASQTKQFESFAGLEFVRAVSAEIGRPWFAIGGISAGNIAEVVDAGATRVAVSSAICAADHPDDVAGDLKKSLTTAACKKRNADDAD